LKLAILFPIKIAYHQSTGNAKISTKKYEKMFCVTFIPEKAVIYFGFDIIMTISWRMDSRLHGCCRTIFFVI